MVTLQARVGSAFARNLIGCFDDLIVKRTKIGGIEMEWGSKEKIIKRGGQIIVIALAHNKLLLLPKPTCFSIFSKRDIKKGEVKYIKRKPCA